MTPFERGVSRIVPAEFSSSFAPICYALPATSNPHMSYGLRLSLDLPRRRIHWLVVPNTSTPFHSAAVAFTLAKTESEKPFTEWSEKTPTVPPRASTGRGFISSPVPRLDAAGPTWADP